MVSDSGLVTLTGGKWTTYRKMAEDVVRKAAGGGLKRPGRSVTANLKIHGFSDQVDFNDPNYWYGSDLERILALTREEPAMAQLLSEDLSISKAQVIWSVREEMARTVEDFLSRRTRAIQLDAAESIRIAPGVAAVMAAELGYNSQWEKEQVESYKNLARGYLITDQTGSLTL